MKNTISSCGKLTVLIGILILFPILSIPFFPKDIIYIQDFLIPGAASAGLGFLMCVYGRKSRGQASRQDDRNWKSQLISGSTTVLYVWCFACAAGALPFVLSGQLRFVQALFEAVSGWTTTGLSVVDVTQTPQVFLFYRSFMQFCGGLGFVMVMILFTQGRQSMNLFTSEGHPDKVMPNLKETARAIFIVYLSWLIIGTAAYVICGMPVFDSILHTMGALSTGGFSNRADSIGAYNSISIEAVTILLMIIGTTNFAVLLLAVRGQWKMVFKNGEIRLLGLLLLVFVPLTGASIAFTMYTGFGEGVRIALFNIVSALSTTGYSLGSYNTWPAFGIGVMVMMMLIGGGIGSTAGGIKLSRVLIMLKHGLYSIYAKITPEHKISVPHYWNAQGKTAITGDMVSSVSAFITCYLVIYLAGTLLLTVTAGASLTDAMFEFASSLGTVGLSIGLTNPATSDPTLIVEIVGMLLGRLEIYIVLSGLYSLFFLSFRNRKTKGRSAGRTAA